MGTAASFAVLAGSTVTNTGASLISGDLGVSPGTAVTGSPLVVDGEVHSADDVAGRAQSDLTIAYNEAAGRTPSTEVLSSLGGRTLVPGVYKATSAMDLTGTVTLNGLNDPDAVFIFQAGSTMITAPNSTVALIGEAQACNVFWQVGSSATLDTNTTFVGTVMALTDVAVMTGSTVAGGVLARNGQVTLDNNRITRTTCSTPPSGDTPPSDDTPPPDDSPLPTESSSTTTTIQPASTTATTAPSGGLGVTTTTGPATGIRGRFIVEPDASTPAPTTLPRTGSPIGITLLLGALALALGVLAIRFGQTEAPSP